MQSGDLWPPVGGVNGSARQGRIAITDIVGDQLAVLGLVVYALSMAHSLGDVDLRHDSASGYPVVDRTLISAMLALNQRNACVKTTDRSAQSRNYEMASPPGDLTTLLAALAASGAEFVLVGGLAAVAQGAPLTTHDIDIVPRRTPENIDRLPAFLTSIGAHYRGRPTHDIFSPTSGALLGPGHSPLMTALGPIDVLGAIEEGRAFDDG